jgi:GNAT superfamily N-acetyltransferase
MADLAGQLGYASTVQEVGERLSEMQDSEQYAVFVAELPSGKIAGWIGAYVFRSVATDSFAEINGLVVDSEARSHGIGKILLDAVEKWARKIGCIAVSVHSNVLRDRAHRFYEKNGYEHVKTQKTLRKNFSGLRRNS